MSYKSLYVFNRTVFPSSDAIIGRKVQNCHPPESVHIVNEIITTFRNGRAHYMVNADCWNGITD